MTCLSIGRRFGAWGGFDLPPENQDLALSQITKVVHSSAPIPDFQICPLRPRNRVFVGFATQTAKIFGKFWKIISRKPNAKHDSDPVVPPPPVTWTVGSEMESIHDEILDNPAIRFLTEAGMIDFDNISVTGKGAGGAGKTVATTSTVSADPLVAYGSVSIGYKF